MLPTTGKNERLALERLPEQTSSVLSRRSLAHRRPANPRAQPRDNLGRREPFAGRGLRRKCGDTQSDGGALQGDQCFRSRYSVLAPFRFVLSPPPFVAQYVRGFVTVSFRPLDIAAMAAIK